MLAACSDNENDLGVTPSGSGSENVSGMLTLLGDQSDRIETATPLRSPSKWKRLHYVGSIKPTDYEAGLRWSATAVAIDPDGNNLYITWHSNWQAGSEEEGSTIKPATKWGGAIDMVEIADAEQSRDFSKAKIVSAVSDTLKFNNVLVYANKLYLSATSAAVGGAVAVVNVEDLNKAKDLAAGTHVNVAVTEFPGASVNAVAVDKDNNIVAVSGHDEGAYGVLREVSDVIEGFVGGKYIVCKGDSTCVLYDGAIEGDGAHIKINGEDKVDLGIHLKSKATVAETYSLSGGWQKVDQTAEEYYGKHVMAIDNDYAYVGTGTSIDKAATPKQQNGLRVYSLSENKCVAQVNIGTTGVYADGEYIYAATLAGLRIYAPYNADRGVLEPLAWEVSKYDTNGTALNSEELDSDVETADIQRHSANFVTAHRVGTGDEETVYVYVACGQSGVNVYKFLTKDMENINGDDLNGDLTTK